MNMPLRSTFLVCCNFGCDMALKEQERCGSVVSLLFVLAEAAPPICPLKGLPFLGWKACSATEMLALQAW